MYVGTYRNLFVFYDAYAKKKKATEYHHETSFIFIFLIEKALITLYVELAVLE